MCKVPCPFNKSCKKKYGSKSCKQEQVASEEACKDGITALEKGVQEKKAQEEATRLHKIKLQKKANRE